MPALRMFILGGELLRRHELGRTHAARLAKATEHPLPFAATLEQVQVVRLSSLLSLWSQALLYRFEGHCGTAR